MWWRGCCAPVTVGSGNRDAGGREQLLLLLLLLWQRWRLIVFCSETRPLLLSGLLMLMRVGGGNSRGKGRGGGGGGGCDVRVTVRGCGGG